MNKEIYKTKQRFVIEEFLKENSNRHMTVDQISDALSKKNIKVGKTTVYRCLDLLLKEGKLQKYILSGNESACYQYVSNKEECHEHFHLKCEKCGKLIHIECDHINELCSHIGKDHGFEVNKLKTVLYGECYECSQKT